MTMSEGEVIRDANSQPLSAHPVRHSIVIRKLAKCSNCGDLIYEGFDAWRHNRTGNRLCGGGIETLPILDREGE